MNPSSNLLTEHFEINMANMVAHCDFLVDGKIVAKKVSPCFFEEVHNDSTLNMRQYMKSTRWYTKNEYDLEMNCVVKEVGEYTSYKEMNSAMGCS